jgi:hypothetical protein
MGVAQMPHPQWPYCMEVYSSSQEVPVERIAANSQHDLDVWLKAIQDSMHGNQKDAVYKPIPVRSLAELKAQAKAGNATAPLQAPKALLDAARAAGGGDDLPKKKKKGAKGAAKAEKGEVRLRARSRSMRGWGLPPCAA